MLFSAFMIVKHYLDRGKDIETFENLSILVSKAPLPSQDKPSESVEQLPDVLDLAPLYKDNSDFFGWLTIPETSIDYPVMHTPYQKEKYLRLNFYGDYSYSGTPFMQWDCKKDGQNLIIHAHNMKNGTMFYDLRKYLDRDFFDSHDRILLQIGDEVKEYGLFSVVQLKSNDSWYSFVTSLENDDLINEISSKAYYKSNLTPSSTSEFITLSTCHGNNDDDRLIIIGVID